MLPPSPRLKPHVPASSSPSIRRGSSTMRLERSRSPKSIQVKVRCYSLSGELLTEVGLAFPPSLVGLRSLVREAASIEADRSLRFFAVGGAELQDCDDIPCEVTVVISARDWAITGCADGSVAMWDANTGEWCKSLFGHHLSVISVALSPDGSSIATASSDHTVRLWSTQRQAWRLTLRGHRGCVHCVSFSGDSSCLVSASSDRTARVWSAGSFGECLSVLRGHRRDVSWAAFSPDDAEIITGSDDRNVILWDSRTFSRSCTIGSHPHRINCVMFSSNGMRIAIAFRTREVSVWAISRPGLTAELQTRLMHEADAFALCFHPARQELAVALANGMVILWDLVEGQQRASLQGHSGKVFSISFSADGTRLASASGDATAKVWSCKTYRCVRTLEGHTDAVNSVCFAQWRSLELEEEEETEAQTTKWWAAFVIKAAGFSCTQDANKKAVISETFRHLHDFTAQVIGICKNATTDVYQRFSGYAARHRRALFCERVLAVLDSLQAAATAIICTEQAAAKPKEAIGRMQDLLLELKFLLQDLNAYGDGSLLEVVEQHLSAMANSINHADSGAGAAATVLTAAGPPQDELHF
ncbi:unnamed protein product [Durusdinium trenchii]|uniref:Guanine nucleotide-binding protein subunit beta-like protein n=1 Tax=Durusdinium trenchii TaxID=1381693 RepID=A0ABP0QKT6_9DINO